MWCLGSEGEKCRITDKPEALGVCLAGQTVNHETEQSARRWGGGGPEEQKADLGKGSMMQPGVEVCLERTASSWQV